MMTEDELFNRRCADTVEIARKERLQARHLVELRRWAIERLLAMPGAEALMCPGWIVDEGSVGKWDEGETFLRGVSKMTTVPPKLFTIADNLVDYVANGEHPKPEEGAGP